MLKTLIKNSLRPLGIELRRIPTQKEIDEQLYHPEDGILQMDGIFIKNS